MRDICRKNAREEFWHKLKRLDVTTDKDNYERARDLRINRSSYKKSSSSVKRKSSPVGPSDDHPISLVELQNPVSHISSKKRLRNVPTYPFIIVNMSYSVTKQL